jgi:FtsZ-binding cell division protein ZapB
MNNELATLAEKADTLIAIVNQLRRENTQLRSRAAQLAAEQKALQQRLDQAAGKLETILEKLP